MERADLDPRWTLPELLDRARRALETNYRGPCNGQVQPLPSQRTLRYYTTLGLLDRPAEMRGRTALYGWRHLLQVVAVKRLQEQGLPLVEVQRRLAGRPSGSLAGIALLPERPDGSDLVSDSRPAGAFGVEPDRRESFWRGRSEVTEPRPPAGGWGEPGLQVLPVDPQLALVWSGGAPGSDDVEALRSAARALIEEMTRRGLVGPRDRARGADRWPHCP